jgi:biuret amidohydrolase
MPALDELIHPASTALVTNECQKGAIGPDALWPPLAAAAKAAVPNIARLVSAARLAGVGVFHGIVGKRSDLRGSNTNAPLYRAATRPGRLEIGTEATELIDELGDDSRDVVLVRTHGVSPLNRTGLDTMLRNAGVRTIVVCGVSVNVAIQALCMDGVNASYRMVVARDAVAGVPPDYARRVTDNTLPLLATVASTDDITAVWKGTP